MIIEYLLLICAYLLLICMMIYINYIFYKNIKYNINQSNTLFIKILKILASIVFNIFLICFDIATIFEVVRFIIFLVKG